MKLISAAKLLPLSHSDFIRDGAILVDQDTILAVGLRKDLKKEHPDAVLEHFEDSVLMPGLVNAHCHLDRSGFYLRFKIETDTNISPINWLLESLRYLSYTPASVITARIKKELSNLLEGGVTCVGAMTHYEGTYPLMEATPIRGVVFQEILSGPDKRAQQRFEVALALVEKYNHAKPGHLKIGFGPFSAYLLSKNLLNIISGYARDHELPLQIHAAENFAEMEFFYDSKGPIATQLFPAVGWEELPPPHRKTPIHHLDDIGFFTCPLSLVGGYHMSEADFSRISRGQVRVVYCPSANRRFQLGTFPFRTLKTLGIPVGLGTEVIGVQEGFDLWEEMRLILKEGISPLPAPIEILKMATAGGASSLGFEKEIGSLVSGKKADYIVVREPQPSPKDVNSLCRELILQTESSAIKRVVIAGEVVKGK